MIYTRIEYRLVRSNRKTISLELGDDGDLLVRAPHRATQQVVEHFIAEKREWVEKALSEAEKREVESPQKQYVEGELYWYLGAQFELVYSASTRVKLDNFLYMPHLSADQARKKLTNWYKRRAREVIERRVDFFAQEFGFDYASVSINTAMKRWGSCSADNKLNFSYRLAMAPIEILDYVVVHELCHTVHKHHQKSFWEEVERVLPDYKARRKLLKSEGHKYRL